MIHSRPVSPEFRESYTETFNGSAVQEKVDRNYPGVDSSLPSNIIQAALEAINAADGQPGHFIEIKSCGVILERKGTKYVLVD
jgi:hypothetical protein